MKPSGFAFVLCLTLLPLACAEDDQARQQSLSNLKQIGLSIAMYADINNDMLPPMKDPKRFQAALRATLQNDSVFFCPFTNEPYRANTNADGQAWQNDADLPLVFEAKAASDKTRAVLFNDGHVSRLPPAAWESVRKQYRIPGEADEEEDAKLSNLRTLGAALREFAHDGDKRLPPLTDLPATKALLLPYTGMKDIFADPETGAPYAANTSLAGKRLAEITDPKRVVVIYETKAKQDRRGVVYLDGRAEHIAETNWPALKAASNIR